MRSWQIARLRKSAVASRAALVESMFFLSRYFLIVPYSPLSMRVWWPFQKNRTCIPFFGSGYAGLGFLEREKEGEQQLPAPLDDDTLLRIDCRDEILIPHYILLHK